jgi:GNAT superfamily N-acetyltransferase
MPIRIRRARPEEAAELSEIAMLSKQSNGYDAAFMALCVDELRITADAIRDKMIWVAETDHIIGCVTLVASADLDRGQISAFFVHTDSKRQGVGKLLWQTVLNAAQAAGLTRLQLDADPAAVPFYEAMGFATIGQIPSGSIPGRFLPLMELRIAPLK